MAIHEDFKKLTYDSLRENLITIDYCMSFEKTNNPVWGKNDAGCLGMSALILLSAVIDTMGSYFRGSSATINVDGEERLIETVSDHFLILNHDKIFDLRLSGKVIYDFYSKYRSPGTHNNTLPFNAFMDMGTASNDIFQVNSKHEVELVRLTPLHQKVVKAVNIFNHYLLNGNWSADHKLAADLQQRSNSEVSSTVGRPSENPTAHTKTIK